MTAWFFLTAYYYAITAGPFATQQQCEQMRTYAGDEIGWGHRVGPCYQAPLAPLASSGPAVDKAPCSRYGCAQ